MLSLIFFFVCSVNLVPVSFRRAIYLANASDVAIEFLIFPIFFVYLLHKSFLEKYGKDNFKFEVLIICFDDDRLYYEVEYIKKFNGYNISKGRVDVSEYIVTDLKEFITKKKEQYRTKVKNLSTSISEKMKKSEKWLKAVGNTKKKIAESVRKHFQDNPSNSQNIEKHREVMCKSVGRSISQYTNEGIFVKSYLSIAQAGRESGVKKPNIQHCLKGTHQYAGGYIWKYNDEA